MSDDTRKKLHALELAAKLCDELARCPFCGGEAFAHEWYSTDTESWSVVCLATACGAEMHSRTSREHAIELWNARRVARPQWPTGDEAAEQLARATHNVYNDSNDWDESGELARKVWYDYAAAVLARLNGEGNDV